MEAYEKAAAANMRRMGTDESEWSMLPFERDKAGHRRHEFPARYGIAPSIYANDMSGFALDYRCELCGDKVKNIYYIVNPKKKWLMRVGEKCLWKFKGK